MSVNVVQLVRSALPDAVVQQLSNCLGLPPEATAKVMDVTTPALVAGLLNKCATPEGARALFATILGQEVNADVAAQLPRLFSSTTGVTQLSSTGRQLLEHTFERRIDGLSDTVSMQTGVPAHATHAVSGIAGCLLLGVLKRYILEHRGNIGQLPTVLGQQLQTIAPFLNDGLTTVLGLGGATAFAQTIGSQVRAVSSHFEHPAAAPAPTAAHGPVEPTLSPTAISVVPSAREVRHVGPKAKHWFGVAALSALIGAIVAMLTWVALALCPAATSFLDYRAAAATVEAPAAAKQADVQPAAQAPQDDAASVAGKVEAQPAPAVAKGSQLIVAVDAKGKPTLTATVQNVAEKSALLNALTRKFGAGNFNADITVDENRQPADWLAQIDALMPLLSTPGAEVKIDGTHVELSGVPADALVAHGYGNVRPVASNATESGRFANRRIESSETQAQTTQDQAQTLAK